MTDRTCAKRDRSPTAQHMHSCAVLNTCTVMHCSTHRQLPTAQLLNTCTIVHCATHAQICTIAHRCSPCMTQVHTTSIFCLPMSKCQMAFIVAKNCPSCLCIQMALQRNCFTDDMSHSLKSIRGGTSKSQQLTPH